MTQHSLRIGGASAAWGDTIQAARQLVERGRVDILTGDYLAEVTMAILARMRMKDPEAAFVPDWLAAVGPLLGPIKARGIRLVTNAGGMNPQGLAAAFRAAARAQGLDFRGVVVTDDDLLPMDAQVRAAGETEMATGAGLPGRLASMNAYLGARPIAAALDGGAECGDYRPGGGQRAGAGPADPSLRLVRDRLGPSGAGIAGGPCDRLRRAGHGGAVHRLAPGRGGLGRHGLSGGQGGGRTTASRWKTRPAPAGWSAAERWPSSCSMRSAIRGPIGCRM